ncbi:IS30 family transposase [Turicibacter sanguinis]|jgi:IS30 family transposase|uniref:IS30 family transposase n=12 Tax=Turicibacter TaxID=191303 RepID=A0A9X5APT7_9FIRM|nr:MULTISPECIES: IS30 family transposase [Turicibacter]NAK07609.1 IS30 family transposase [Escherichia coli]MBP3902795.1 IS30 family transposase [Turicibacter sp.]MCU7203434.1 IS30 family transposase [Turicibacter sanguinis]MDB8457806.1 IS30 family transposase [Turicibacter sanguinis]MDB8554130.1 IS30 family transposase [Turicibacter sanguinis]
MSYKHLNTFERTRIEVLSKMGYSTRQIAQQLNRHHSTIARELKRNTQKTYQAELAEELAGQRRLSCRCPEKKSEQVIQTIQHYLKLTWSPEQISNTVLKGVLSFKTIYRWIYDETILLGDLSCLRQKGKRRKPRETRGRFNIGTSIHQRPKEVKRRETFGHWELDTVVSSRGKSKGCLATFVERQTRFYVAIKIENRSATEMYRAISELYKLFPKDTFKTYTVDRGKEFACYSKVEADLKVPVYFADAYSSWQRGSNENANGLLREFFPKKTDLARVSDEEINEALCLINHRPRKCLGWKTSFELFHEKLSHLY